MSEARLIVPSRLRSTYDPYALKISGGRSVLDRTPFDPSYAGPAVYLIVDPRSLSPRYVGQTCYWRQRRQDHLRKYEVGDHDSPNIREWFSEMRGLGVRPLLCIIERPFAGELLDAECRWITQGLYLGWPLLNNTTRDLRHAAIHNPCRTKAL